MANKMEYELATTFDSCASFYRKAMVRTESNKTILRSYSSDVAHIEDGKAYVYKRHSQTTMRHIKEFLKQNGFKAETKEQIIEDYPEERKKRMLNKVMEYNGI